MSTFANTARNENAFENLEAHLRAMSASGERLAAATSSLRASARVFAAAAQRLQPKAQVRRHLQLVK